MDVGLVYRAPRDALLPLLTDLCGVTFAEGARPSVLPPDEHAAIVVHARRDGTATAAVRGPSTRAGALERGGLRWALGVQLQPGLARGLLGVPLEALADQQVPLADLWGDDAARLEDALSGPATMARRLDLLEDALHLRRPRVTTAPAIHQALRALESPSAPRIADLAAHLGVSARQLRRQFNDAVGVGPKEYAALLRFRRAWEALEADDGRSWAEIALDAGYCDQAHMNLDFRQRAGRPPGAWLAARG